MAASADFENPWACTVTARLISPRPSTLTSAPLWHEALGVQLSGPTSSRPVASTVSRLTRLVLDAERVLEPLQLRDPHVQRHLAAFEVRRDGAAGLLALGAAAGGLAALAADAAADALAPCSSPGRASDRGP